MRWIPITILAALAISSAAVAGTPAAKPAANDRSLTFTRNGILVPTWINKVGPYPFLLDTGIPRPVIAQDVAAYLKLAPSEGTVGAKVMECGGMAREDVAFSVMDLAALRQRFGVPVAGVFSGREFKGSFVLDIQRQVFQGCASDKEPSPRAVPLTLSDTEGVSVQALVNGAALRRFAVDTTFAGTLALPEATLREMGWKSDAAPRLMAAAPAASAPQVRLKTLRVGGAELIDPICTVADGVPRIGLGFLKHFRATFDCEGGQLTLQPLSPRTPREEPVVGCGLAPARLEKGLWTLCVAEGSSAARQGVLSGDLLLKVDDKDMRGLPYQDIHSALDLPPDGKLTVTVSSGASAPRTVTLAAERLL